MSRRKPMLVVSEIKRECSACGRPIWPEEEHWRRLVSAGLAGYFARYHKACWQ